MNASQFYTGIVPEVYAALRGSHFAAERYRRFVREAGQPALELGCGDDGPFFDLAADGIDIDGVDSSIDMVRRGRERLHRQGLERIIHHQSMEALRLDRRYAAIYLAGPTFNLLPDDGAAGRALRAIAEHLLPDGVALIPLWTPPPTPSDDIGVVRTADIAEGEARFVIESEDHDRARRTRTTHVRYEVRRGGRTERVHRDWIIHWFDHDGFEELAAAAGLVATIEDVDADQVEVTARLAVG